MWDVSDFSGVVWGFAGAQMGCLGQLGLSRAGEELGASLQVRGPDRVTVTHSP